MRFIRLLGKNKEILALLERVSAKCLGRKELGITLVDNDALLAPDPEEAS